MYCNHVGEKLRQRKGKEYPVLIGHEHMLKTRTFAEYECNEYLLYHGAKRAALQVCEEGVSTSYSNGPGYFGPGFYMSCFASKADCYTRRHPVSNQHTILLMRAFLGNAYDTDVRFAASRPPDGYDSIYAPGTYLGRTHSVVKYPEMVIFKDTAAIPAYVITYSHDTKCKCTHCGR
jgi:hypothetical protein